MTMQDTDERNRQIPGDFDDELWPESPAPVGEAEGLLTLAETASDWALQERRAQQDDEELLPEAAAPATFEAEAAVEEWTAGMVRPPLDAEAREWEEEPIEPISQASFKSPGEAELEAKYGI